VIVFNMSLFEAAIQSPRAKKNPSKHVIDSPFDVQSYLFVFHLFLGISFYPQVELIDVTAEEGEEDDNGVLEAKNVNSDEDEDEDDDDGSVDGLINYTSNVEGEEDAAAAAFMQDIRNEDERLGKKGTPPPIPR